MDESDGQLMNHYTITTGHSRFSPRDEVGLDIIKLLQPMLTPGKHPIPGKEGYTAEVLTEGRSLLCTVWDNDRPCVTFGVAPDRESSDLLWPALIKLSEGVTPVCPSPPWVAVAIVLIGPSEVGWLGDFERCLAWAWVDKIRQEKA